MTSPSEHLSPEELAKRNGQESAFSLPHVPMPNGDISLGVPGLTKREYAAIQIAAGLTDSYGAAFVAQRAVEIADALLRELAK